MIEYGREIEAEWCMSYGERQIWWGKGGEETQCHGDVQAWAATKSHSGPQLCSSQSANSMALLTTKGYEDRTAQSWPFPSSAVVLGKAVPSPQLAAQQRWACWWGHGWACSKGMRARNSSLSSNAKWWHRWGRDSYPHPVPHHCLQVVELALRSWEWENWSCPSLDASLWRVSPALCLGSTLELTLVEWA